MSERRLRDEIARVQQGHVKYRDKLRAEGKLFVRDRLHLLLDPGTEFQEDWLLARSMEPETPADGVVTGVGTILGRPVCVMANDFTVKAGSWGEKTVQKIVRIQEKAARLRIPLLYLVDAAGGRISEQIRIFPGRYHAGLSPTPRCYRHLTGTSSRQVAPGCRNPRPSRTLGVGQDALQAGRARTEELWFTLANPGKSNPLPLVWEFLKRFEDGQEGRAPVKRLPPGPRRAGDGAAGVSREV